MDRLPSDRLAPAAQRVEALAYDRRHRNARPSFRLEQTLHADPAGGWVAERVWCGVDASPIARERSVWHGGWRETQAEQTSIGEWTAARLDGAGVATSLRSHRTRDETRQRHLNPPHAVATLGSLPLLIAANWTRLLQGESVRASFLVLKVQRAATVRLTLGRVAGSAQAVVLATPTQPLLRWIFGSTRFVFDADAPRLHRIEGLLDPRDLRPNGRWIEYLGTVRFERPLDLCGLVPGAGR